jgi:putative intracellular protease/amidase
MKSQRVLCYVSSANAVPFREGGSHTVGVFLGELTEPLEPLLAAGHTVHFVSPDGRGPHIDRNSFRMLYWRWSKRRLRHAQAYYERLKGMGVERPMKLDDLLADPEHLDTYDVLFVPGGHAPMTDILFRDWLSGTELNHRTGKLLEHFHRAHKTTALICHAPCVLAAAPDSQGIWIYHGYRMTCITMLSERLVEDIPLFKVMDGHLPDYPQHILQRKGARVQQINIPMWPWVVEDRELITGQDPYSATLLGKRLLAKMARGSQPTLATGVNQ